jgi:threonine dehydratase
VAMAESHGMALTPTLAQVREAQQILAAHFPATRMARAPGFSRPNSAAYVKIETELPTVLSWKAGHAVPTETCDTCADGLATRTPEPQNVRAIREIVDNVVLVSEEEMIQAIRLLYLEVGVVAEPAGAAATAAYLNELAPRGPVVLLVSGGNISDEVRGRAGLVIE